LPDEAAAKRNKAAAPVDTVGRAECCSRSREGPAAIKGSEDRMFAVVARTLKAGGPLRLSGAVVRVTHTLLFIAALAVSPGVCGACARGCLERDASVASGMTPRTGTACAVAAIRYCGSCCVAMDGASEANTPPGRRPADAADAADGILNTSACCGGGLGCGCLLEPRDDTEAVPAKAERSEPAPATVHAAAFRPSVIELAGAPGLRVPLVKPPERSVRVLYGVWRN